MSEQCPEAVVEEDKPESWRELLKDLLEIIPEDDAPVDKLNEALTEVYQRVEYILDTFTE